MAAALAAFGVAGVSIGRWLGVRGWSERGPSASLARSELVVGRPFPDVRLVTVSDDTLATSRLLSGRGGIVLFLDPECPSCAPAARRWQDLLDHGKLPRGAVVGIGGATAQALESYRRSSGLSFPIHRDPFDVFRREYGVRVVPYEVVVGRSGIVRAARPVPRSPMKLAALRELLAR